MIHVPDVRATAAWYETLGFTITGTYEDDGEMSWARLAFGSGAFMLNEGGRTSNAERREVDLYVETDDVSAVYAAIKDRVTVREGLHDTFYGMREFVIRDINGFWITFGEPVAGDQPQRE
jgi:uncharacterized glyoxalase superfamily protein PhnB